MVFWPSVFLESWGAKSRKPHIFQKHVVFGPWYPSLPAKHMAPKPLRDSFDVAVAQSLYTTSNKAALVSGQLGCPWSSFGLDIRGVLHLPLVAAVRLRTTENSGSLDFNGHNMILESRESL